MTDEEKMFGMLVDIRKMIVERQLKHEANSKAAGPSGKRTHGNKARECCDILEEMNKILEKYNGI